MNSKKNTARRIVFIAIVLGIIAMVSCGLVPLQTLRELKSCLSEEVSEGVTIKSAKSDKAHVIVRITISSSAEHSPEGYAASTGYLAQNFLECRGYEVPVAVKVYGEFGTYYGTGFTTTSGGDFFWEY
ncbi:hypothetical protein KAX06_07020 [candidate division WOR-3 bacterium]|nr:hypothetical protein [candidate division WOR-3 bacterium]